MAGVGLPRNLGGRREEATTPSLSCAPGLGPAEGAGPFGQLMKAQSRSGLGRAALVGLEEGILKALEAGQHRVEARGPVKRP